MNDLEQSLRNFLNIPYDELQKLNLEMKADRRIGKDEMYFRTKIIKYLKSEPKIKAITVCFSDIEGRLHMLDYDKNFILESDDNLTFDGSSIRGFTQQSESDLRLNIDWSSFRWLPSDIFGSGKVLVFSYVKDKDGTPYKSCFRSMLRLKAQQLFTSKGLKAMVSPEIEGFLIEGVEAEQNFDENKGFKLVSKGGYYHSLPQDLLKTFIDRSAEAQRAMAFENEKDHPEVAPSQFELNYKYAEVVEAADQIQLYKLTCRQVAKSLGCTATFLPKPLMGINGSGMHLNFSLQKGGSNIFFDKSGESNLSEDAWKIIYTTLYHAKEICLILNPSVNAYRRLDPHFEAPNEIKVSSVDRGAMVRIPIGNKNSARFELRSVGPDANPYMAFFTLLSLSEKALNSTKKELQEFETVAGKREKLPGNIYDAIRYFKNSPMIKDILDAENHTKYIDLKKATAHRSPRDLGKKIKNREILDHPEIWNQMLWNEF